MYLHKENSKLFRDVILITSQKLEVSEDIVEKDYYVTLILKKLSETQYPVVLKAVLRYPKHIVSSIGFQKILI